MDTALYLVTETIISAEELWLMDEVKDTEFVCHGCRTRVKPIAWQRKMKYRPHFRIKRGGHIGGCDIDGKEKLIAVAKTKRVSTETGFPISYPNKLVFRDFREKISNVGKEGEGEIEKRERSYGQRGVGSQQPKKPHNYTVTTIRPIVNQFLNFPYDRHLSVDIPGIEAITYNTVFRMLSYQKLDLYKEPRIFFGGLYVNKYNFDNSSRILEIPLIQGLWSNRNPVKLFKILVHYETWSNSKITALGEDLDVVQAEKVRAFKEGKDNKQAWVFFIGRQDESDPMIFHVFDHKMICCVLADKEIYPGK